MGKKRRQQTDNNLGGSDESTESADGDNGSKDCCPHFNKAVDLCKLRKLGKNKFHNFCMDCKKIESTAPPKILDSDDEALGENPQQWICLQCGHIACGRYDANHAEKHSENKERTGLHCVVVDTQEWTAWCYKCETYIDKLVSTKRKLQEAVNMLQSGIKSKTADQPKIQRPLGQIDVIPTSNEKMKNLNDLPRVGGLTNLGNTCFFNAVLQCLAQTPYLIKVLDDLQVPDQTFVLPGGKFKVTDDEEVELPPIEGALEPNLITFTPVLKKTLLEMQNSNGQIFRPTELFNTLRKKTMQCTDGGQHDSHELLRHLLELVRTEDLKRYQSVILRETGLSEKNKRQSVDDNLRSRLKYYGNQANAKFLGPERVFRGELVSTLQCMECRHTSPRTEPFLDLSLPILVDKSVLKRKSTGFDNLIDSVSNNVSNTPKHESKKALYQNKPRKNNKFKPTTRDHNNVNCLTDERKGNVAESEESDADIEDNIENEDVPITEVGESGYVSEKASALTSPVSAANSDKNVNIISNVSHDLTLTLQNNANANIHCSPSPTDVQMTDLSENKNSGTTELSLMASLITHSDITSPEGPTISPLSSPMTSKDSPTSPISSAVDGDDIEKVGKVVLKYNTAEKQDLSDKEDSLKKVNDTADENLFTNKENNTTKKLTNGFGDITSTMSKLDLSSPSESPRRYTVKEGECSIQLCLNQFTALELMTGNNKVGCEACTEREKGKKEGTKMVCTESTKRYLISCVPAVLILHLKRFQVQKFSSRKVGKHVSFPMVLDLSPVCKDPKPRIYALYGIVEHSGTMYGGHYVAYVKSRAPLKPDDPRWSFLPSKDGFENNDESNELNLELTGDEAAGISAPIVEPPPGRWYYVSDGRVQEVEEKTVLSSEAYLLFYERIL